MTNTVKDFECTARRNTTLKGRKTTKKFDKKIRRLIQEVKVAICKENNLSFPQMVINRNIEDLSSRIKPVKLGPKSQQLFNNLCKWLSHQK